MKRIASMLALAILFVTIQAYAAETIDAVNHPSERFALSLYAESWHGTQTNDSDGAGLLWEKIGFRQPETDSSSSERSLPEDGDEAVNPTLGKVEEEIPPHGDESAQPNKDRDAEAQEPEKSFVEQYISVISIVAGIIIGLAVCIIIALIISSRRKKSEPVLPDAMAKAAETVEPPHAQRFTPLTNHPMPENRSQSSSSADRPPSGHAQPSPSASRPKPESDPLPPTPRSPRPDLRTSPQLCLQDLDDPDYTYGYPLRNKVLIGKDPSRCQIVIEGGEDIAEVHCEVIFRAGIYYVREGGISSARAESGAFVDGQKVEGELLIHSGAVLQLGQTKRFKVVFL